MQRSQAVMTLTMSWVIPVVENIRSQKAALQVGSSNRQLIRLIHTYLSAMAVCTFANFQLLIGVLLGFLPWNTLALYIPTYQWGPLMPAPLNAYPQRGEPDLPYQERRRS